MRCALRLRSSYYFVQRTEVEGSVADGADSGIEIEIE